MNTKTLYLSLVAVALFAGAGSANAARAVSVADSVRLQMRAASANIEADTRASLKAEIRQLDVPGVEAGEVRVVADRQAPAAAPRAAFETAEVRRDSAAGDFIKRDLATKALAAPGLFGVYRYMAVTAINAAMIVAE